MVVVLSIFRPEMPQKRTTDTGTELTKENIVGEEAENKRIDALLFILL